MSPIQERPDTGGQRKGTFAAKKDALSFRQTHPGERRKDSDRRVCFDRREMIRFDADRRQLFDRRQDGDPFLPELQ